MVSSKLKLLQSPAVANVDGFVGVINGSSLGPNVSRLKNYSTPQNST